MNCDSCGLLMYYPDEEIHTWCGLPSVLTVEEKASIARHGANIIRDMWACKIWENGDDEYVAASAVEETIEGKYYIRTRGSLSWAEKVAEWPVFRFVPYE